MSDRYSQIFEIFRLQPDGSELYVGQAASYNIALFDVEMLASKVPAKYIIRDRETGQGLVVNLAPPDSQIRNLPSEEKPGHQWRD